MLSKFIEDSIYSKSFYSCGLNVEKFNCFYNKAVIIRYFKNDISNKIYKNMDKFVNMLSFDMINHFKTQINSILTTDIQNAIIDVHTAYINKFDQINNKIQFKIYTTEYLFYTNNSKKNLYKKGDLKNRKFKSHSTKLTSILTYLAKYCKDINQTINYITNQLLLVDLEKQLFYTDVLNYINKYEKDRITNLIKLKRKNIKKKYNQKPINFESLTFRTTSKINHDIISYNDNYNSIIKTFITVGGIVDETGKGIRVCIPVRYSKKYHGDMNDYNNFKNQKQTNRKTTQHLNIVSYTVVLDEKKKELRIVLTKEGLRETWIEGDNRIGVDVNVKHNLFSTSDNITFDYDRVLISDYIKFLKFLDNVKTIKTKMKLSNEEISRISNKNKVILEYYQIRILNDLRKKCSDLVKYCKLNDKDHIILEDLSLFGKSFSRSEEFEGFKYSRLTRLLNLASIKEIIKGIAYKNGISISFVQPHYTSQQCPVCGHIHKDNRKTQEEFKCLNCDYEDNSDYISSLNIKNRISVDVLQKSLLKTNKKGEFEPKILSKEFIKSTLLLVFE